EAYGTTDRQSGRRYRREHRYWPQHRARLRERGRAGSVGRAPAGTARRAGKRDSSRGRYRDGAVDGCNGRGAGDAVVPARHRRFRRVDVLVNNAGTAAGKPTDELSLEAWRRVIDCNLTGAFLCSREALKIMKQQRSGRILNIGSVSAKAPRSHSAAYATSKFGLQGLTHSLAVDGREYGIAASVLQPG